MALSKVDYNSLNVTAAASKALKWNSTPNGFETGDVGGDLVLIKTLTASSSGTLSFVNGSDDVVLNSTYKEYVFKFIDIHPGTDNVGFTVNFRDGSSAYDATKTTTHFYAYHDEGDSSTGLSYRTDVDLAQATGALSLGIPVGADADQCITGTLHLFDPSSTTFVKHFLTNVSMSGSGNDVHNSYVAGYCNVTAAIDGVQFAMASGNIDAGTIKMYGVT